MFLRICKTASKIIGLPTKPFSTDLKNETRVNEIAQVSKRRPLERRPLDLDVIFTRVSRPSRSTKCFMRDLNPGVV